MELFRKIASLRLTVVCLLLLMVLVFWGTLYQVEHGLYAAQQRFYSSWFFTFLGFIPFPGTQLVLTALFANLLAAMLFHIRYGWRYAGVVLIHAGLLLLLGGGFITHHHAQESFLTLAEGEGSNLSASYHHWELSIWDAAETSPHSVLAVDTDSFVPGKALVLDEVGLTAKVELFYRNCRAFLEREDATTEGPQNASGIGALEEAPRSTEPGENLPGCVLAVSLPDQTVKRVLLFGGDTRPTPVRIGDQTLNLALRRERSVLPLIVRLRDFRRELHPNSEIPSSYSSLVEVDTAAGRREVLIEMNKPLRYKGFTLYQSSFSESGDGRQSSTFAVVRNFGRLLPYVASGLTFLGLLNHFLVEIYVRRKKEKA